MLSWVTRTLSKSTKFYKPLVHSYKPKNVLPIRTLVISYPPPFVVSEGVPPAISPAAMQVHYDNFVLQEIRRANSIVMGTPYHDSSTLEILQKARTTAEEGMLIDLLGNILNHELYFASMVPGGTDLSAKGMKIFASNFGTFEIFTTLFKRVANSVVGNGWVFVIFVDGKLQIVTSRNGATLYGHDHCQPLLALDLHEHSYCFDYVDRKQYIEMWWLVIDWEAFEKRLTSMPSEIW